MLKNAWRLISARLAAIPPARFVVAITPILTIASGYLATLAARYLPGVPGLTKAEILIWGLGVAAAVAAILHRWLIGQSQWEQLKESRKRAIGVPGSPLDHPEAADIHPDDAVPDEGDLTSDAEVAAEEEAKQE